MHLQKSTNSPPSKIKFPLESYSSSTNARDLVIASSSKYPSCPTMEDSTTSSCHLTHQLLSQSHPRSNVPTLR
eukprot:c16931_g1_i1 orf=190-408(-)